ncbi:MAG TPA: hypothetical protein DEA26_00165 [Oceanospirillales bacterium]|nr:hypothetical protein [Oceanospirillaceae bacterium]HBS41060.1 hypothetical protein [Oceanospirillales bacterium]|tara:strand:- start:1174 stop:1809 length:636 start_codon:yes stop_codon:yes gene_type:complete
MRTLTTLTGYLTAFLILMASSLASASSDPRDVVTQATDGIIAELEKTKPAQRTPEMFRNLVTEYILPAIDQEKIAMGALGKYWRQATPGERKEFIDVFRERQLNTYSGAFKAYDGQDLTFSSTVYSPEGDRAIVKGQFMQSNGQTVPVDFRLYKNDDGNWLIYDAIIAGLSMVKTYRTQLTSQLQNKSIQQLLADLRTAPIEDPAMPTVTD